MEPEVSLEGFQVGDFEVGGHEGVDVAAECFRAGAVFRGEGVAVGEEGWGVPLCG